MSLQFIQGQYLKARGRAIREDERQVITMNESLEPKSHRNWGRIIIIAGFLPILVWQSLILFAAPAFIRLWSALYDTSNQQFPWVSRFLFGNEFVRWAIFIILIAIVIYFVCQKQTQFLFAMVTFFLMLALTIVMHVSLYAPLFWLTR